MTRPDDLPAGAGGADDWPRSCPICQRDVYASGPDLRCPGCGLVFDHRDWQS